MNVFSYCLLTIIMFEGASVYISTLSLTAIALDRLKLMTHLTARWLLCSCWNSDTLSVTIIQFCFLLRSNTRTDIIKIISINIVSLIAVLPYCLHMEVRLIYLSNVIINNNILNPLIVHKVS